ncbi:MAG: ribosome recycling factor [Verrucomicrobiota bacterium]
MTPDEILSIAKDDMQKAVDHTQHEFSTIHTGKASSAMVENVNVEVYGSQMRLMEVAAIMTPDARTISIQPFDKGTTKEIEKAIIAANLGLNPVVRGQSIICPLPELSGERRKEMVKMANQLAEAGRVGVRAARQDAMNAIKAALKDKEISEDEEKRGEKEIQTETDKAVKAIDELFKAKETELTTV